MNQVEFNAVFRQLTDKMEDVMVKKGNDYANTDRLSNFKQVAAITDTEPAIVALTLMGVKISRLVNLLKNEKEPNNESIDDNAIDLCNYAILAYACIIDPK